MANGKPNRPLRPRGGSGPGNRRRRVVIDNQAARPRDPRQGGRDGDGSILEREGWVNGIVLDVELVEP